MNADENKMLIGVYLRSSAAINDFFTASQGACLLPAVCLEGNLHGHLNVPRGAEGGDRAERRATGDAAPNGLPVAVVQDVEEVGAKLRVQPLREFEIPAKRLETNSGYRSFRVLPSCFIENVLKILRLLLQKLSALGLIDEHRIVF